MARKLDKLIRANEAKVLEPIFLADNSLMFHTCCRCKARHAFAFRVHETETGEKFIEMNIYGDEVGSELRRAYERNKKRL